MSEVDHACANRAKECGDNADEYILLLQLSARLGASIWRRSLCGGFALGTSLLALGLLLRLGFFLIFIIVLTALVLFGSLFGDFFRVALDLSLNEACTAVLNLVVKG